MDRFLYLEGAYLILGGVILAITLFVSTRPFMPEGAWKKGISGMVVLLVVAIGAHYAITTSRMEEVKRAFTDGEVVICESRMLRKAAQSIRIAKHVGEWRLQGDYLVSPHFSRPFFTARCIVE